MKGLIRSGNNLAVCRIRIHRISAEANLQIRIDCKKICLNPCTLTKHECRISCCKGLLLTGKIRFQRLVIAILHSRVNVIKPVVIQNGVVLDLCFAGLEFGNHVRRCLSVCLCCRIQEIHCVVLINPPLHEAGRAGLIALGLDCLAGFLEVIQRLGSSNSAVIQNVLIPDETKVISFDGKTVAALAAFLCRCHCCCHAVIHGIHDRLSGQVIGILAIGIDFHSGGRGEDIRNIAGVDLCLQKRRIIILRGLIVDRDVRSHVLILIDQGIDCICILRRGNKNIDLAAVCRKVCLSCCLSVCFRGIGFLRSLCFLSRIAGVCRRSLRLSRTAGGSASCQHACCHDPCQNCCHYFLFHGTFSFHFSL